ncbi:hypothetical protein A6R68_22326, partial [Neotoma lepida]
VNGAEHRSARAVLSNVPTPTVSLSGHLLKEFSPESPDNAVQSISATEHLTPRRGSGPYQGGSCCQWAWASSSPCC